MFKLQEPTTAITDFLLGLESFAFAALLTAGTYTFPSLPYWTATLIMLGIAALLGGFAHGLARFSIFAIIYPCLAILMTSFILATLVDSFGQELAHQVRWFIAFLALIFMLVAWRYPTRIRAYAVVLAALMILAFLLYLRQALTTTLPGSAYIAAGIATTILAAALLLKRARITLIWTFDHNGVYHLVQMVGVLFFYLGLSQRSIAM
ncbi:MAG: hypothetical protein JSW54_05640 [Fidelibacterota bacterium]|nr:MAG: hypothetical protein JSW54_05640 [Candidatus Neomarinimicrobiota bacterium]